MAKDPAFLFYPTWWIRGTSYMMPEEKGVYIDLLAHQHQDQDLPNDTRRLAKMCGLGEDSFLKIWETVGKKFILNSANRLVNRKLTEIMTERSTKSTTNKIIGQFASIIRLSNMTYEMKEIIKKEFNVSDFEGENDRTVKERLTEWIAIRSESIKNIDCISIYKEEVKIPANGKKNQPINFRAQGEELLLRRISEGEAKIKRNREEDNSV